MITLSDEKWVGAAIASMEAEYLVSLMAPINMIETPSTISPDNHLKLVMHDIEEVIEGYIAPNMEHVEQLIEFGYRLDESSEVVVHCLMGMSRSPAAVMILLALNNPGREAEIVDVLFSGSPKAHPNRLLLQIGDQVLGSELEQATFKGVPFLPAQEPAYTGSLNGFQSFSLNLDEPSSRENFERGEAW